MGVAQGERAACGCGFGECAGRPPRREAAGLDGRVPRIALRSLSLPARRCGARAVHAAAACGSYGVPSRSMAQATLSSRSATERSERAWPWPRPRSAS